MEQQTLEKMQSMHMTGMSQTYHEDIKTGSLKDYTPPEYISRLIDAEWEHRENRKIKNLKKGANFRTPAHPLNIDYTLNRQLDKTIMQSMLSLDFLKRGENIIFTGPTGTGKSFLAQAIGTKACEMLHKVMYFTLSQFTDKVDAMKLQGNYVRWIKTVQLSPLLIIDDFGLTSIDHATRKALVDIIDYRYEKNSIIFVSQIPVKEWHTLIGENTIADAIMDRIVHNSHRIDLKGESIRRQKKLSI